MEQAYSPASRRPIADVFRKTAHAAVRVCLRLGIHPDAISYASMVFAALAAVCFWQAAVAPWLLVVGPLLCYARLWCNMLDGMVALAACKASPRGEILNELPDRISDLLIFVGVAHSGLCSPLVAYWAAIFALLTAYVGTLGQAAGARREFAGLMSKPWRMVVLHLGAWATFAAMKISQSEPRLYSFTILDCACLVVIAGCIQTIFVRLKRIFIALPKRDEP